MSEERVADEPCTAAWRTAEQSRSDDVATVRLLDTGVFARARCKQVGALGADPAGVSGAPRRAECEAYAGAVTDREWAHHASHP